MSEPTGEWILDDDLIYELEEGDRYRGKRPLQNRWHARIEHRHMDHAEVKAIARMMFAAKDLLAACEMQALADRVDHRDSDSVVEDLMALLDRHGWTSDELMAKFIRRFRDDAIAKARGAK